MYDLLNDSKPYIDKMIVKNIIKLSFTTVQQKMNKLFKKQIVTQIFNALNNPHTTDKAYKIPQSSSDQIINWYNLP